ncbi:MULTISPECIES: 2OG-Fe dioxygenase family protein [Dyella]|uniref:2OG-Fe dioxygenase family protein n=2 Tax=Dyella TaxID=231454 RepID=A0A4R0YXL2_9GAMM|nr:MULTISPECIES: 2OG-Fe dioxygenase family protein [Dyella]TBR40309.1 hypothetical protein EYV96_09155 [Dyella terrae]TCI12109.1 hypothetical protein EZM97_01715 [Dyella soli]
MSHATTDPEVAQLLQQDGFAFVDGPAMADLLWPEGTPADWPAFVASWNALEPDTYLAAKGRQRRRRHAVFRAGPTGPFERLTHQPHYQSLDYNALQGGIERWFAPVEMTIGEGASLRAILHHARDFFGPLAPQVAQWRVEIHQFRIEASALQLGEPTPEGVHRDGVNYVLVLLIDRENIESGTTTIHLPDGTELGSFTLTRPLDAALVDDARVCHGVTAVTPQDATRPAHRDVLVVTLKEAK